MALPGRRIRVIAGTPIQIGDRRILPSVLVTTLEAGHSTSSRFRSVRVRPISFVAQGPEGAQWQEIPNATANILVGMGTVAAGVAVVALALSLLIRRIRA